MQTYKLLEQDTVLLSQPLLIEHFGRAGAQFLSQLHYWLQKNGSHGCKHQDSRWIYNSAESWAQQLHLSVRQIRRLISKFVESGILQVKKLNPCKSIRTNYYSINYDKLACITSKTSQNRSFIYDDILSPSSCHNGTIYIEAKTTNKDFNKSEDFEANEVVEKQEIQEEQVQQVEPVKNQILTKESLEEKDLDLNVEIEKTLKPETSVVQTATPKTSTAQDMLTIWNDALGEKAKTQMSKDLAPMLVSAHSNKFEKSLDQWRTYCELIKTSTYLMSEQFNLSIFWGLKFSTIDRVRGGELGVKPDTLQQENTIITEAQVEEKISNLADSEHVKALRRKIAEKIGTLEYISWFHHAEFLEKDGGIQLIAPNSFVENTWETRFSWIYKSQA